MKVKLEMIENERENFNHRIKINKKIVVSGNIALLTDFWDVPVLRPGGSLTGGGGLLDC